MHVWLCVRVLNNQWIWIYGHLILFNTFFYWAQPLIRGSSVLEEEEERGVAHIVEHLAFSATAKYTNHDIVKFLESIGAEFGACQNAMTSADETVYELLVPVDRPELLSQAISVLAEFSSEVQVLKFDNIKVCTGPKF